MFLCMGRQLIKHLKWVLQSRLIQDRNFYPKISLLDCNTLRYQEYSDNKRKKVTENKRLCYDKFLNVKAFREQKVMANKFHSTIKP